MTLMKTVWGVLIIGTCAQFFLMAGEAAKPKPGEAPPPLGLERMLQAPGDARPSWTALRHRQVDVPRLWSHGHSAHGSHRQTRAYRGDHSSDILDRGALEGS